MPSYLDFTIVLADHGFALLLRKHEMNTRKLRRLAALPLLAILAAGCSTAPPTIDTSEGAEATFDGLYPVLNSRADAAWAVPGMDLSGYTKIMLRGEGIEYRPGGESGRTMMSRSNGESL